MLDRVAKRKWTKKALVVPPGNHFWDDLLYFTRLYTFPWPLSLALQPMEAGGIEPPSRDASDPASTCLANCCLSRPPRSLLASVRCASLELF